MSRKVIYAGTFDPITKGHLDIIQRAASLFDQVIVAIAKNPSKQPLFSLEERTALVSESCLHLSNVQAVGFSGLLADFALEHQAQALIRGIRGSDDLEYEIQLAQLNHKLAHEHLETIFFPPSVELRYISSTMVREIYKHHGDISHFVPPCVLNALALKSNKEN
ncbi:phosphopantetheine adenylyltransferase [Actinobacillus minor NM305]|uniref:Phosphopantetheine adenylyltransferase n=1 Tax=Actinobacillus minor NM305 TaxID=637911 RepID=C5RYS9_9PAST|nr:pantetheine-phosphate adenylyltransferase [Actinobacillus minor]EER48181.1 phosphopantetheine adenylyltransferase [Actinobacillus minor NM305]